MKLSPSGLAFIKAHEGLRLDRYLDVAGVPTVGYGHAILPGEKFNRITEAQAHDLLCRDVATAELAVNRLVTVPLNQGQFDALASFTFNVGAGAFKTSTLLRTLNAGNYGLAADQFPRWCYANGGRVEGLLRRRDAERRLFIKRQEA